MEFINWDDVYKTGIEIVDYQHKRLVQILNDLHDVQCKEDLRIDLINMFLDELILYTKYHFKKEEEVMLEIKFNEYSSHRETHKKFIDKVTDFQKKTALKEDVVPDLLNFLKKWLVAHIEVEDKKYVEYIMSSPGVV